MKNIVEEIISSLSKQEFREFKYFLSAGDTDPGNREDIRLLEMIRSGTNTGNNNDNAQHQTKKRLKKKLEQFAMLENLRCDDFSRIHALMETAKYLFRKNLHRQAWEYLLKAEQMAIDAEEYRLLDYNYDIQIAYSYNVATMPPHKFSVPALLQQWQDNRSFATIDSNANAAYALLIYELREQFSQQLSINIDELISDILKRYGLNDSMNDNKLRIYCKTVSLVCRTLREKREYNSLKNYAINHYKLIGKKKVGDKVPADFIIDLLDAICVAALRSGDYKNCEKYTRLYEIKAKKMLAHPDEYSYYDFIVYVGVADLCLCTNRLDEAKQSMLTAQKKYARYIDSVRIAFLLRVNLIAVHFSCGEFDTCIRLYNEIKTLSEKKILHEPGFRLELVLFSDIYAIIFHYEEGDNDYALYLLDKFKRRYSSLLNRPDSRREKLFIRIMEQILAKAAYIKSEKFRSEADQFILLREFIAGDFEYISMNAWLQSKISGRPYYSCFLDIVQ